MKIKSTDKSFNILSFQNYTFIDSPSKELKYIWSSQFINRTLLLYPYVDNMSDYLMNLGLELHLVLLHSER